MPPATQNAGRHCLDLQGIQFCFSNFVAPLKPTAVVLPALSGWLNRWNPRFVGNPQAACRSRTQSGNKITPNSNDYTRAINCSAITATFSNSLADGAGMKILIALAVGFSMYAIGYVGGRDTQLQQPTPICQLKQ